MRSTSTCKLASRLRRSLILAAGLAGVAGLAGCRSNGPVVSDAPNPALRQLTIPANATPADEDRAALARFIGVWDFEGWSTTDTGHRQTSRGAAAATSEHEHFVLIEVRSTAGQLSGEAGRSAGSMLLAVEPGNGLTLSAWGDAAPAIRRLSGSVHGSGATFWFEEFSQGTSVAMKFETDDRWIAEVRKGGGEDSVIATYTFTRRAR